ncbi:MAG: HAD family hydrolase [Acidobacteria bacterium]|nr:HAD family hydrolase [Acidobacteriota bacterium]
MNYTTIFLDRDGVINRKRDDDYVKHWGEFEFLPGVKEALKILTEKNYRLIVVTNQRGIARGLMTMEDLQDIHARMVGELTASGAEITAIFCCPHDKDQCDCRKPKTGMFLQAQQQMHEIEFAKSILIGDSLSDMEAGAKLGCRNILIGEDANYDCATSLSDAVAKYQL